MISNADNGCEVIIQWVDVYNTLTTLQVVVYAFHMLPFFIPDQMKK